MKRVLLIIFLLSVNMALAQKQVSFLVSGMLKHGAPPAAYTRPPVNQVVPFEVRNGKILLQGVLNGRKGYFILDTGAPQLVVNGKAGQGIARQASSCNGTFSVFQVSVEEFAWAGGVYRNFQALSLDLGHLAEDLDCELLGIIGYEQIKGYELLIDYRKAQLLLFDPDKGSLHRVASPSLTIPFVLEAHLPVLTLRAGSVSLRLGLDTGAEDNLVDGRKIDGLNNAQAFGEKELLSLDQSVRLVSSVRLQQLSSDEQPLGDQTFLVTDFRHVREEDGIRIDGLLGYPFFEDAIVSINYARQKIYIWDQVQ